MKMETLCGNPALYILQNSLEASCSVLVNKNEKDSNGNDIKIYRDGKGQKKREEKKQQMVRRLKCGTELISGFS